MFNRSSCFAFAAAMSFTLGITALPASAHVRAAAVRHAAALGAASLIPRLEPHVFARGSATLTNPDGIVVTKRYVFVVFQNTSDSDPTKPSTIMRYDHRGNVLGYVNLLGRCDGMRLNPVTHKLWALLNNDGLNGSPPRQPLLYTIDPRTLATKLYRFGPVQPHGGGYDDVAFINGKAFLSASSATIPASGINDKPVILSADLDDGKVVVKPIVYGNTIGTDAISKVTGRLNLADPDSLSVTTSNQLVMDSEGDQQLAFIDYPGTAKQKVTRYALGTGVDDSAWTRGNRGTLFVADDVVNAVYAIEASFPAGTIFSEATSGTPVSSFIGTFDPATGFLTPLLTELNGIVDPTSLIFTRAGFEDDDE